MSDNKVFVADMLHCSTDADAEPGFTGLEDGGGALKKNSSVQVLLGFDREFVYSAQWEECRSS